MDRYGRGREVVKLTRRSHVVTRKRAPQSGSPGRRPTLLQRLPAGARIGIIRVRQHACARCLLWVKLVGTNLWPCGRGRALWRRLGFGFRLSPGHQYEPFRAGARSNSGSSLSRSTSSRAKQAPNRATQRDPTIRVGAAGASLHSGLFLQIAYPPFGVLTGRHDF
jgi:hypothetical protein